AQVDKKKELVSANHKKLIFYHRNALKNNVPNVQQMESALYATLLRYISTDEDQSMSYPKTNLEVRKAVTEESRREYEGEGGSYIWRRRILASLIDILRRIKVGGKGKEKEDGDNVV
ncbi:hypothetical protein L9F63_016020, partial [Diploptera punctata]